MQFLKNSKLVLALALGLALSAGTASTAIAAPITESVQLNYAVASGCTFTVMTPTLEGEITHDPADGGFIQALSATGITSVNCNQGTAYEIESSAETGGRIDLVGANTGNTIPAYMFQGNSNAGGPGQFGPTFASSATGEAISGVATGGGDIHAFSVAFNTTPDGRMSLEVPAADVYSAVVNLTLTSF